MAAGPNDDRFEAGLADTAVTTDDGAPSLSASVDRRLGLGDKLGRFEIVKELGAGGMGVVYVALDPTLNRQIAIKLLRSDAFGPLGAAKAKARLMREAQAMARLSHPNVIAVHEIGTAGEQVFVVMELNDDANLTQWLKRGPSWRDVTRVFLEAGAGLVAAHAAGMIHRDFKPDNVLIARDGRVRVTDFGLVDLVSKSLKTSDPNAARVSQGGMLAVSLTQTGAVLGTPPYMAPEQHDGHTADERTDQYSFCVSLFQALYGQRPFGGDNYRELVMNILDGNMLERPSETEVPLELHDIMLRGLSTSPSDRFEGMTELLSELRNVVDRPQSGSSVPQPARPRKWLWIGSAGLVVATVAAASIAVSIVQNADGTAVESPADAAVSATRASSPEPVRSVVVVDAGMRAASAVDAAAKPATKARRASSKSTRSAGKPAPKQPTPAAKPAPAAVPTAPTQPGVERRRRELDLDFKPEDKPK